MHYENYDSMRKIIAIAALAPLGVEIQIDSRNSAYVLCVILAIFCELNNVFVSSINY